MWRGAIFGVIALAFSFFWNEWNLSVLPEELSRNHTTVYTLDDASYLRPFDELYQFGTIGKTAFKSRLNSVRPPGYGLFYYFHLFLFGEYALKMLTVSQILLYGLSIWAFFELAKFYMKSERLASISTAIFMLIPWSIGFHYYTLSEGITPALLLIGWYLLISNSNGKTGEWKLYLGIACLSFLLLTRPVLIVLTPVFLYLIWLRFGAINWRKIIFSSAFLFSGLLVWQGYYLVKRGTFLGLHPIYQAEIPGLFRPAHAAIWDCFKGWESDGAHFHETIGPFWEGVMKNENTTILINEVLKKIPKEVKEVLTERSLRNAFLTYADLITSQKWAYLQSELLPPSLSDLEQKVIADFQTLEKKFRQKNPVQYFAFTPIKVAKNLVAHSNLSLYLFQHPLRGRWWLEGLRFLSFGLHILAFTSLLFTLFLKVERTWKVMTLFILVYLFYLIFFQRGIEERYTAPFLAFAFLNLGLMFRYVESKFFVNSWVFK
jgi:hypothetical protein